MDEAVGLQNFLTGFHDSLDRRMERQTAKYLGRLDALERRVETAFEQAQRLRVDIVSEVAESLLRAVRSVAVNEGASGAAVNDGVGSALAAAFANIKSDIIAAALASTEVISVEASRKATQEHCGDVRSLQAQVSDQVANFRAEIEARCSAIESAVSAGTLVQKELLTEIEAERGSWQRVLREELSEVQLHVASTCSETLQAQEAKLELHLPGLEEQGADLKAQGVEAAALAQRASEEATRALESHELHARELESLREHLSTQELAAKDASEEARRVGDVIRGLGSGFREHMSDIAEGSTQKLRKQLDERLESLDQVFDSEFASMREFAAEVASEHSSRARRSAEQWAAKSLQVSERKMAEGSQGAAQQLCETLAARLESELQESKSQQGRMETELSEESARLDAKVWELRQEAHSVSAKQKISSKELAEAMNAMSLKNSQVAEEVKNLMQQGLSHEWVIPKCMQRLEFLAISSDAGVWLESPPFKLGSLGALALRLYPRGLRGSDGQCGVGLLAQASREGQQCIPLRLNLSIGGLNKQAVACCQDDGSVLWVSGGFGRLEDQLDEKGDLRLAVEVPPRQWTPLQNSGMASFGPGGPSTRPSARPDDHAAPCRGPVGSPLARESLESIDFDNLSASSASMGGNRKALNSNLSLAAAPPAPALPSSTGCPSASSCVADPIGVGACSGGAVQGLNFGGRAAAPCESSLAAPGFRQEESFGCSFGGDPMPPPAAASASAALTRRPWSAQPINSRGSPSMSTAAARPALFGDTSATLRDPPPPGGHQHQLSRRTSLQGARNAADQQQQHSGSLAQVLLQQQQQQQRGEEEAVGNAAAPRDVEHSRPAPNSSESFHTGMRAERAQVQSWTRTTAASSDAAKSHHTKGVPARPCSAGAVGGVVHQELQPGEGTPAKQRSTNPFDH